MSNIRWIFLKIFFMLVIICSMVVGNFSKAEATLINTPSGCKWIWPCIDPWPPPWPPFPPFPFPPIPPWIEPLPVTEVWVFPVSPGINIDIDRDPSWEFTTESGEWEYNFVTSSPLDIIPYPQGGIKFFTGGKGLIDVDENAWFNFGTELGEEPHTSQLWDIFIYSAEAGGYYYGENQACIPEPATIILLGTGLAGLIGFRKRSRNRVLSKVL